MDNNLIGIVVLGYGDIKSRFMTLMINEEDKIKFVMDTGSNMISKTINKSAIINIESSSSIKMNHNERKNKEEEIQTLNFIQKLKNLNIDYTEPNKKSGGVFEIIISFQDNNKENKKIIIKTNDNSEWFVKNIKDNK